MPVGLKGTVCLVTTAIQDSAGTAVRAAVVQSIWIAILVSAILIPKNVVRGYKVIRVSYQKTAILTPTVPMGIVKTTETGEIVVIGLGNTKMIAREDLLFWG